MFKAIQAVFCSLPVLFFAGMLLSLCGVRIEDTLVVADETSGHAPELLTRFPKELAILA